MRCGNFFLLFPNQAFLAKRFRKITSGIVKIKYPSMKLIAKGTESSLNFHETRKMDVIPLNIFNIMEIITP